MRGVATLFAAAALCVTGSAHAQDIAKALCDDALKGDGAIDPVSLRSTALGAVTTDTLDYDHDGTPSADEIFRALTTDAFDFCTVQTATTAGRAKPCADGQADALRAASGNLTSFWAQKGTLYDLTTLGMPSGADAAAMPDLTERPWALLLDPRGRFERAVCRPAATVAEQPKPGNGPTFLLGSDIDSLTVARTAEGADRLAKVKSAALNVSADNVADTRSFAIDAVAGLRVLDSDRLKLIPFVQYSRSQVRDRKADTDTLTGKFAAGAVGTVVLGWDQIDVAPLYARDLKTDAEFLTGRVAWRPGFLYRFRPFDNAWHFACKRTTAGRCELGDGLVLWTDFQMIGSFGTVLAKGNDPSAIDGRTYVRVGPSAALHIYGWSGPVRDLSFDASYKRLFTLSGNGRPVYALKADLSYWIGGSEHVALITGYERGRDEETLDLIDTWKLGLGVRF